MAAPEFLWRRRDSALQRVLLAPLAAAECGWRLGARLHRGVYTRGWRARASLPCGVVSVGNLAVGGSGKTPLVGWLARALRARARRVAILSRGVGGSRVDDVNVVSDGERVLLPAAEVGDEPAWLAAETPGVPVLAGRNRLALGLRAVALFGVEIALLDDGFQHHRLRRDLDLLCIDAQLGLGNAHVLPRGPLREPPCALRRADALVYTRVRPGQALADAERMPAGVPRFSVAISARELRDAGGGAALPLDALRGRRIGLLAAIARPGRLERDLARFGAAVVERRIFPDHHGYRPDEIRGLAREIEWVTTAKDAVKIPASWLGGRRLWVLVEEVAPEQPDALLDFVLAGLDRRTEAA
jgi:tetraacyldisaccharide 4'-kinase